MREQATRSQPQDDPSLLLTKTELAKHLRCSERQVDKLTADGKIPSPILLGNSRRWPRSAIESWIDRLMVVTTQLRDGLLN